MHIEGNVIFRATRERVYAAFIDKNILAKAIPGIQTLEEVEQDKFEGTIKVGVAGITATYKGTVNIENKHPPESYTLAMAGEGPPGFMRGTGSFELALTDADQTNVAYKCDIEVGGQVAAVGQRVLGGVAKILIGQFMTAMKKHVEVGEPSNMLSAATPPFAARRGVYWLHLLITMLWRRLLLAFRPWKK